jgi:NAD(P)-dependent dehydrogenase (short-subunit alcohol dehydrogenase family)
VPPLIHEIERELGEVDILVNNAATVMPLGPVTGVHPEAVLRALTSFDNSQIDVDGLESVGPARTLLIQVLGTESGQIWDTTHPDSVQ